MTTVAKHPILPLGRQWHCGESEGRGSCGGIWCTSYAVYYMYVAVRLAGSWGADKEAEWPAPQRASSSKGQTRR